MATEADVPKTETAKKQPQRTLRKLQQEVTHLGIGILLMLVVTIIDFHFFGEGTVKKRTRRGFVFAILVLIVVVVTCYSAVMNAQERDSVKFGLTPPGVVGYTGCDTITNLSYIVLAYGLTEEVYAEALAHEKVHARRVREYGRGCKAFRIKYNTDVDFQFREEREAYCLAQYKPIRNFAMREYMIDQISIWLYTNYKHPPMTYKQLKEKVISRCVTVGGMYEWPP